MNTLYVIFAFTFSFSVNAFTIKEFCKLYSTQTKKIELKHVIELMIKGHNVVKPINIDPHTIKSTKIVNDNKVFLAFFRNEKLSSIEKDQLIQLKNELSLLSMEISKTLLYKELKTQNYSFEKCVDITNHYPEDFKIHYDYFSLLYKNETLFKKEKDEANASLIYKQAKSLKRIGYEIHFVEHFSQIQYFLEKATSLFLLAHSTEDGILVDALGNPIPKGYFSNLSDLTKQLVIYSCHSSNVIKYYNLNINNQFQVLVPEVRSHRMKEYYKDTIPMIGLKAFKRVLKKAPVNPLEQKRECSVEFNYKLKSKYPLPVYLDDHILGFLSPSMTYQFYRIRFPCHYLNENSSSFRIFEKMSMADEDFSLFINSSNFSNVHVTKRLNFVPVISRFNHAVLLYQGDLK